MRAEPNTCGGGWRTLLLLLALGCSSRTANPGVDAGGGRDAADAAMDQLPSCICGASSAAASVANCMFRVGCTPGDFSGLAVKANGVELARDQTHTEGWEYTDATMTTIRLFGSACADVTNGARVTVDQLCTGP